MKIIKEHFFDKINNAKVFTEPFNHLVIDELLPSEFYVSLAKQVNDTKFDDFDLSYYASGASRVSVDITNHKLWKNSNASIPTTLQKNNYKLLKSRNLNKIKKFTDCLLDNEEKLYSALKSKLPTDRDQKDYFFHISLVKDGTNYEIAPHPDDTVNIFTILFYTPETDCNKEFGLDIYSKDKEPYKKVDFLPNKMIAFAPSAYSFHGVQRLKDKLVGTRNSFQMFFYTNNN